MLIAWVLIVSLLLPAVYYDLQERRIPNRLIGLFLLVVPVVLVWVQGWGGLLEHVYAMALAFAIAIVFWGLGWLGAGDVKLVSLVALTLGMNLAPALLINVGLAGLVLAIAALVATGTMKTTMQGMYIRFVGKKMGAGSAEEYQGSTRLPYAVAIAAGAVLTMLGVSPIPG